jgi:LemA protein
MFMKIIAVTFGTIGLIFLICLLTIVGSYNGLIASSQAVDQQWAQVQNVYQRRADLVPNLVATVSGAAHFEQSTLEAVTEARASVGRVNIDANSAPTDAAALQKFEQAQGGLSSALSRLLVVTENYPDLKSSQSFIDLQAQLEGTENRISVERGKFNQTVQDYDTRIATFPDVLMAHMMGLNSKPYFAASAAAQTPPQVQFDFNNSGSTNSH